jgi:choline kinase
MVVTPNHRPIDPLETMSPLILPVHPRTPKSPAVIPIATRSGPPLLRKSSTGSFSKLSDFRLDGPPTEEEKREEAERQAKGNGVQGVKHVDLSIDAG